MFVYKWECADLTMHPINNAAFYFSKFGCIKCLYWLEEEKHMNNMYIQNWSRWIQTSQTGYVHDKLQVIYEILCMVKPFLVLFHLFSLVEERKKIRSSTMFVGKGVLVGMTHAETESNSTNRVRVPGSYSRNVNDPFYCPS